MAKTYTKREIAYLLKCSVRTVEEDARHLNLKTTVGDRNQNLYSEKDFELIKQMRKHCADKTKTRDSFLPNTEVEIIEDEPKITKLSSNDNRISLFKNNQDYLATGLKQDPFFDLEVLQRISDKKWLIPATRLAPIIGITPKYLNKLSTYIFCGFVCTKEIYAQGIALWKVEANNS